MQPMADDLEYKVLLWIAAHDLPVMERSDPPFRHMQSVWRLFRTAKLL